MEVQKNGNGAALVPVAQPGVLGVAEHEAEPLLI